MPSVMVGSRFASRTSEAARDEDVSHRGESDGSLHVRFLTNWYRNLSVVGRAVKGVRNGVCIPVSAAQFFFAKSKPPAKPVVYSMPVRHFYRPR